MARPKLPESAKANAVKIYMRDSLRKDAAKLAFARGISLSQLVSDALRRAVTTAKRSA